MIVQLPREGEALQGRKLVGWETRSRLLAFTLAEAAEGTGRLVMDGAGTDPPRMGDPTPSCTPPRCNGVTLP